MDELKNETQATGLELPEVNNMLANPSHYLSHNIPKLGNPNVIQGIVNMNKIALQKLQLVIQSLNKSIDQFTAISNDNDHFVD